MMMWYDAPDTPLEGVGVVLGSTPDEEAGIVATFFSHRQPPFGGECSGYSQLLWNLFGLRK
jgi:hypothetical protein